MHAFLQLAPVRARAAMAARRRPRRLSRRGTAKAAPRPLAAPLEVRRPMSADLICATDETSCRCEAARWRPRKPLRIPRRIKRGGVGVPPILAGSNLSGRRFDTPARHHRTFARRGFLRLRRCGFADTSWPVNSADCPARSRRSPPAWPSRPCGARCSAQRCHPRRHGRPALHRAPYGR